MIVLDASAVVEWLLGRPRAAQVTDQVLDPQQSLHAPHLIQIEVAHAVRRIVTSAEIGSSRGAEALVDLADLDVQLHDHSPLLPMIWHLRGRVSAYDAAYVALAMALDAPLLTGDRRLARTVADRVEVRLLT